MDNQGLLHDGQGNLSVYDWKSGLVTISPNPPWALQATLTAEFTAHILIKARSMGVQVEELDQEEVTELRKIFLTGNKQDSS